MGRLVSVVVGVALLVVLAPAEVVRAQQGSRFSVPFSDPSRPGTVRVNLLHSGITVKSTAGKEVVVLSRGRDVRTPPADSGGLRRLDPPAGVSIEEENNVLTIHGPWLSGPIDVEVEVPVRTNLVLRALTGDLLVEGVDGEQLSIRTIAGQRTGAGKERAQQEQPES